MAAAGALGRAAGQDLTPLLFRWDFAASLSQQTINRCFVFVCLTATADLFGFLAVSFIEFSRIEAPRRRERRLRLKSPAKRLHPGKSEVRASFPERLRGRSTS